MNGNSQSEKDFGYAMRMLEKGKGLDVIAANIESFRRGEKPNPAYYARHTVECAYAKHVSRAVPVRDSQSVDELSRGR
jgi:hypothetical protein